MPQICDTKKIINGDILKKLLQLGIGCIKILEKDHTNILISEGCMDSIILLVGYSSGLAAMKGIPDYERLIEPGIKIQMRIMSNIL